MPEDIAFSGNSRLTRKANVPWKELDGIAIILLLDTGDYFELDALGLEIWKLLDGERSLSECAALLSSSYDVPADVLDADVQAFGGDLLQRDLVTLISA